MWYVGIDISDQVLDYYMCDQNKICRTKGKVKTDLEGMAELFTALEKYGRPEEIAIAMESVHQAWAQTLLDRGYTIYPINPKRVQQFRETLTVCGDKSDAIDSEALAWFLVTFQNQLRPWRCDDPEIVKLRLLTQEHTAKICALRALLKTYYSLVQMFCNA